MAFGIIKVGYVIFDKSFGIIKVVYEVLGEAIYSLRLFLKYGILYLLYVSTKVIFGLAGCYKIGKWENYDYD